MYSRDVKFGNQIEADWPQMGQIWDFLRSVSVHFGTAKFDIPGVYIEEIPSLPGD